MILESMYIGFISGLAGCHVGYAFESKCMAFIFSIFFGAVSIYIFIW